MMASPCFELHWMWKEMLWGGLQHWDGPVVHVMTRSTAHMEGQDGKREIQALWEHFLLILSIIRTYPYPLSPCEVLKAAWRLHWISILDGIPAEGDNGITADPQCKMNNSGEPSAWCARLATLALPSQRKSRPQDISSSVKFFGLYSGSKNYSNVCTISRIHFIAPPNVWIWIKCGGTPESPASWLSFDIWVKEIGPYISKIWSKQSTDPLRQFFDPLF